MFIVSSLFIGKGSVVASPESSPYCYRCISHSDGVLNSLSQLYYNKLLCDVTLVAEDTEFVAHRVVLASGSPYFHAMFTHAHIESRMDRILLSSIEPSSLESILEFLYTSTIEITETNVQNLLSATSLLQITPVTGACCEFLRARLDPENCLGICSFAEMHGCQLLRDVSWRYTVEHFLEVSKSEEFLSTPFSLLDSLVQSEDLNIKLEENVLDAVLKWCQHDLLERQNVMVSLLQNTKLPLIPLMTLQDKLSQFPVASNPALLQLLKEVKSFQSNLLKTGEDSHFKPRKSMLERFLVYVVGGEMHPGRNTVSTVEVFSPAEESWKELAPMLCVRRGVGVGILKGLLYAVGGSDGIEALQIVECYNPRANSWTRVANLNEARSSVACAVVEGKLYAIGGYDGVMSCLASVEVYDPDLDSWSYVSPMNTPRSMMSAGVVDDRLYIVGGYDGSADLSSCEKYDPSTNTWVLIQEMNSRRCMSGVGVVDGLLYVLGGCDCALSLDSVEIFDPCTNTWSLMGTMLERRSGLGVAVVGGKLYAIGGYTGSVYCDTIECYDPSHRTWSVVSSLSMGRRRFGCCS